MIVNNAAALEALFVTFELRYQQMFQQTASYADKLATTIPTNSEILRLPWIGRLPTMREWIGDRQVNNAFSKFYDITPKLFEMTEGLNKSKIDDDQWGLFASNILPQMAMQARKWPDYRIVDTIRANGLWSDGLPFFDENHPVNVDKDALGTYANDYPSTPLTHNNYAAVRQAMMAQVGEDGKSLGIMPNLLIAPPQLEQTALLILKASMIAPGAFGNETTQVGAITNVYQNSAELLVIPELSPDADTWYLVDTTKPVKPFVWALREAPSFAMRVDPRDPVVFDRNEYLFGARARGEAGFGFPFLASRAAA
jgi:phage major head subunit gpT-like protein